MSLRPSYVVPALATIMLTAATPALASILISAEQVGSNVVINVSGSLSGGPSSFGYAFDAPEVSQDDNRIVIGQPIYYPEQSGAFWFLGEATGPASPAWLTNTTADESSGDWFLFQPVEPFPPFSRVGLPVTYVEGSPISSSATFYDKTIADFGWTSSTNLQWTFADAPGVTVTLTAVPEPQTLALLGSAAAALAAGLIRRRFRGFSGKGADFAFGLTARRLLPA